MNIPVICNGVIDSGMKAVEMKARYGVDGIMIGRAATGNPWIFREVRECLDRGKPTLPPTVPERVEVLRLHIRRSVPYKGDRATLLELRKQYSGYFRGLPGFKPFRMQLVTAPTLEEVERILGEITAAFS